MEMQWSNQMGLGMGARIVVSEPFGDQSVIAATRIGIIESPQVDAASIQFYEFLSCALVARYCHESRSSQTCSASQASLCRRQGSKTAELFAFSANSLESRMRNSYNGSWSFRLGPSAKRQTVDEGVRALKIGYSTGRAQSSRKVPRL